MKILLLNPHVDAQHKLVQALQKAGHGVLLPEDGQEAWQMLQLHAGSVDLAIIHRENRMPTGNPRQVEPGMQLVERIKGEASQADLPIILSSSLWRDGDFGRHQQTSMGVNAYLVWPFEEARLQSVISSMFPEGTMTGSATLPPPPKTSVTLAPPKAPAKSVKLGNGGDSSTVLEDASQLFERPEGIATGAVELPAIQLEAPETEADAPAQAGVPALEPPGGDAEPVLEVEMDDSGDSSEPPAIRLSPPSSILAPTDAGTFATMEIPLDAATTGQFLAASEPQLEIEPDGPADLQAMLDTPASGGVAEVGGHGEGPLSIELGEPSAVLADAAEPAFNLPSSDSDGGEIREVGAGTSTATSTGVDAQAAHQMPYLFQKRSGAPAKAPEAAAAAPLGFAQPVGDSIVPGGAAHSPDVETLKKYLLLREQDVAVLSSQLQAAQDRIKNLEEEVRGRDAVNVELGHELGEVKRKLGDFDRDKQMTVDALQREIGDLRFEVRAKTDKARVLEGQVHEATEDIEKLKERVRSDIRKIRVREKELENRLEIMKKDSEALIAARENKIIELKRKIDLLEFNMDLLQDQYTREKEHSTRLRERLAKAAQVVRVAGALLDGTERETEAKLSAGATPADGSKKREAS